MKTCCSTLLLVTTLLFTQPGNAKANMESQVVGPANLGGVYTISQCGVRVAYVATKGSRLVVSIDGVEGPLFDELYGPHGNSFFSPPAPRPTVLTATPGGQTASTVTPVIFSDNGEHYAYAGRQGNDYVVIHDGKEIARGPRETIALDYGNLTLSPGGRYVYWDEMTRGTSRASWRLMMNGKPGPWSGHQTMLPTFSPDDQHYTYVSKDDPQQRIMIVDGKEAGYLGNKPVWTADSKLLLAIGNINYKRTLLVNGKAAPSGQGVRKVIPAPVGSRYAAIVHARTENNRGIDMLYLDGKEVPGTEGARDAWFSPDGKRYAVACENTAARSMFMVVDGKKGLEYQGVSTQAPFWTADSSKLIYTAVSGGRNFVIVEGQEFAITGLAGGQVVTPKRGNRYAFASVDGANRNHAVILDGESVLLPSYAPMHLSFSDDGSRFTYAVRPIMNNQIAGLVVDGTLENELGPIEFYNWSIKRSVPWYLFSPDGAHLARVGSTADRATQGLFVDGKLVYPSQRPIGNPAFTADGKHLY